MRRLKQWLEWAAHLPELLRVLRVLSRVEAGRRSLGPQPLLEKLRGQGRFARARDATARARLCRAIAWADARLMREASCYRRALLEVALDRTAAAAPFFLGIDLCGERLEGHAWVGAEEALPPFAVRIQL